MPKSGKIDVYKSFHKPPPTRPNLGITQNPSTPQAGKALDPSAKTRRKYLAKLNLNQYHGPPTQSSKPKPHAKTRRENIWPNTAQNTNHNLTPYTGGEQLAQYGPNNSKTHKAQTQARLKA